jgi:hypothetical protein
LHALDRIDPNISTQERLEAVNRIVAARIVHYWPRTGTWRWCRGPRPGSPRMILQRSTFPGLGRRDYREILAKGVGLCGMAALAVAAS